MVVRELGRMVVVGRVVVVGRMVMGRVLVGRVVGRVERWWFSWRCVGGGITPLHPLNFRRASYVSGPD